MKTAIILAALVLSGCSGRNIIDDRLMNSDTVRLCLSGGMVMRDRRNQKLYMYTSDGWTDTSVPLAPGITPEKACQ